MAPARDDIDTVPLTGTLPPTTKAQIESPAASPSQAETTLSAIVDLLERHKNSKKSSESQISASHNGSFDSTMSVDHNLKLLSELQAIIENHKEQIPRSGVAEEDIDLDLGTRPIPELQQRVRRAP